jgi:hypothetical protein
MSGPIIIDPAGSIVALCSSTVIPDVIGVLEVIEEVCGVGLNPNCPTCEFGRPCALYPRIPE